MPTWWTTQSVERSMSCMRVLRRSAGLYRNVMAGTACCHAYSQQLLVDAVPDGQGYRAPFDIALV
jgi:hypothetical protein